MKNIYRILLINSNLFIALIFCGCSYGDYLTTSQVYNLGDKIKGVQVYVNVKAGDYMVRLTGEAPLYRAIDENITTEKNVSEGIAKEKNLINIKEKEIEIDWGTPGIILDYTTDWVKVDFGGDIILIFSKGDGGIFYLDQNQITINGIVYKNVRGIKEKWTILEFDYDKEVEKIKDYEYKTAPGKKIK